MIISQGSSSNSVKYPTTMTMFQAKLSILNNNTFLYLWRNSYTNKEMTNVIFCVLESDVELYTDQMS